jgi:hypothetical protein
MVGMKRGVLMDQAGEGGSAGGALVVVPNTGGAVTGWAGDGGSVVSHQGSAYRPDAVYAAVKQSTGSDVTLPADFLADFDHFARDAELTQRQYDKALHGLLAMSQSIVDQGFQHAMKTGIAQLERVWGADARNPRSARMQAAWRAFSRLPDSLRTQANADAIGNHPIVLQILEHFGREGQSGSSEGRLDQIYADAAFMNERDPRHAGLVDEARALFEQGHRPRFMAGRSRNERL